MIYKILIEKREELLSKGDPLAVNFTVKEINVLSDPSQLRLLKLKTPFPGDFEKAVDVFDCANKIVHGDNGIYRMLEFCILRNRVLQHDVTRVFSGLERDE